MLTADAQRSALEMYGSISIPATADAPPPRGSTIWSGVVNLSNTIVGAGMLGLPGAFGGTGWLSGIILIVVSAAFSAHGLVLLSKAACISGRPSSFYSVALASVPRYTILIDLAVALKCFGVATGEHQMHCQHASVIDAPCTHTARQATSSQSVIRWSTHWITSY